MNILVDTHILLWFFTDDPRLNEKTKKIYLDTKNKLSVSAATFWEIAIKASLGKITLKKNWLTLMKKHLYENAIQWLPISPEHCHQLSLLPFHHRDPFDRMLIAQAMVEEMKVLTSDPHLKKYEVECIDLRPST